MGAETSTQTFDPATEFEITTRASTNATKHFQSLAIPQLYVDASGPLTKHIHTSIAYQCQGVSMSGALIVYVMMAYVESSIHLFTSQKCTCNMFCQFCVLHQAICVILNENHSLLGTKLNTNCDCLPLKSQVVKELNVQSHFTHDHQSTASQTYRRHYVSISLKSIH